MATLEYAVTNQEITTTKTAELVKNTIGYYTVKFTVSGDAWTGLSERWAVFNPDIGESYKQPLDSNGECEIPGEVMSANALTIGIYGVADGIEYPTVWAKRKWLRDGAYEDCPVSEYPEPSPVLERIETELEGKADKIENGEEGNVVIIGNNSNIEDSGISKDNLLIAPQLASNNIKTDSVPYVYRQTGGGIGVGNREYDSIVGGSVVFNQKVKNWNFDDATGWAARYGTVAVTDHIITVTASSAGTLRGLSAISNGQNTFQYTAGHKLWIAIDMYLPIASAVALSLGGASGKNTGTHPANTWFRQEVIWTNDATVRAGLAAYLTTSIAQGAEIKYRRAFICDLTEMFGSTVADRLYAMETASQGSAIAILKRMFPNDTYPYTAQPSLDSVSLSSHQMKDGNGNVIAEYPLDSSLTLRGVAILDDNNNIKFDGDTYAPDGMVTRRYGIRAYQSGDESLANAITDMTNTVYKLTTPTTETAEPYDALQICDPLGTEEYVSTGICPVGHVTKYPENQVAKLDGLPSDFSRIIAPTEKAYKATRTYTVGRLLIVNNILYKVISAISSGATLTVGTNISETTLDEVIASL